MGATVTITPVDEIDDLFCKYRGQSGPQPVELSLDIRTGALSCAYDPTIGGGSTFDHYHRLILAERIPCLTAEAANAFMAEVVPLAQLVVDGATVEWDGSNHVGRFTTAAMAAWERITELCDEGAFDDSQTVSWWSVSSWFSEGDAATVETLGITADTTDEQLEAMAKEQVEIAATNGAAGYNILDDDETLTYLTGLRDELRDEVRKQLWDVAEEHEETERKRNRLIRQVKGWRVEADDLRSIGALAGISHTEVRRISMQRELTIQIRILQDDQRTWRPVFGKNYTSNTGILEDAAGDVLATQAIHVGPLDGPDVVTTWRVVVWAGHDADTSTEPLFVYDEAKRQARIAREAKRQASIARFERAGQ